jgi:cardiolipin synthase
VAISLDKAPTRTRDPHRGRRAALVAGSVVAGVLLTSLFYRLHEPQDPNFRIPHGFGVAASTFVPSALLVPSLTPGNRVEFLENGDQIFPSMLAAIRAASTTITFEAYIFWSGKVGASFRDALAERAAHGVTVRVLLDAMGSPARKLRPSDVEAMQRSGCNVAFFHRKKPWSQGAIDQRTHRRILVVDGRVGFTGSVGFADEWLGNADTKEHWRDTQVRLEGPVVTELQAAFQENWSEATGETLAGAALFPHLDPAGTAPAEIISSSSRYTGADVQRLYAVALAASEKTIDIANSYFLPDRDAVALMTAASARGVRVRILVPGKVNDVPATKTAGRAAFGDLLKGGVGIWEYSGTMFHQKSMVVDGLFATLGSANFDNRSFRLNEEDNLVTHDAATASRLEEMFDRDLAHARPYTYAQWRSRTLGQRISEWALRPFRSQL